MQSDFLDGLDSVEKDVTILTCGKNFKPDRFVQYGQGWANKAARLLPNTQLEKGVVVAAMINGYRNWYKNGALIKRDKPNTWRAATNAK